MSEQTLNIDDEACRSADNFEKNREDYEKQTAFICDGKDVKEGSENVPSHREFKEEKEENQQILSHRKIAEEKEANEQILSHREITEVKEENVQVLSHREIMHVVQDTVAGLISNDPLLKDLHPYVTLEEVNSMIALEYGQAMVVNVRRGDGDVMSVVVKQDATVLDLKHGIKRYIMLKLTRSGGSIGISWRYTWKRYWLYYAGEKLMDDNKPLKEYGIRNKDEVTFMKRLREK